MLIYVSTLHALPSGAACESVPLDFSFLLGVAWFLLLSGAPILVLRSLDSTWRDQDTAFVCIAACIGMNKYLAHKAGCPMCVYALAFSIVPRFFSVLIAHKIGARLNVLLTQRSCNDPAVSFLR